MREDLKAKLEKAKPMLDAVLSGKSKPAEHLAEYLKHAERMPSRAIVNLALGFGAVLGGIGTLGWAAMWAIAGAWLIAFTLLVAYPVVCIAAVWGVSRLLGPRTPRDKRKIELRRAASAMQPYMPGKRLQRALGPAMTTLLEESARNWHRTVVALDEPFWTDANLPAHWRALREHVLEAVDDAMGDLVLLIQPHMKPFSAKNDWRDIAGIVVNSILGVEEQPQEEELPPMFGAARDIAEKLKLLAAQVEQASRQVVGERAGASAPSATSLDACLSELKSIQQAEGELQQNIGQ